MFVNSMSNMHFFKLMDVLEFKITSHHQWRDVKTRFYSQQLCKVRLSVQCSLFTSTKNYSHCIIIAVFSFQSQSALNYNMQ